MTLTPLNALATELMEALDSAGYEYRSYSGRCMYGDRCVGVDLSDASDIWQLALMLAECGMTGDYPAPKTDSMGLGIIVYWPDAKIEDVGDEEDE